MVSDPRLQGQVDPMDKELHAPLTHICLHMYSGALKLHIGVCNICWLLHSPASGFIQCLSGLQGAKTESQGARRCGQT